MTNPENKPLKGRIKVGTKILQDRHFLTWPDCLPPRKNPDVDPEMVFYVIWVSSGNGGHWDCVAPGYGQLGTGDNGDYGNGSISVHDKEGIELVDSLEEVKPLLADESSIDISPTPLTKEEVEAMKKYEKYDNNPMPFFQKCLLIKQNLGDFTCRNFAIKITFLKEYCCVLLHILPVLSIRIRALFLISAMIREGRQKLVKVALLILLFLYLPFFHE